MSDPTPAIQSRRGQDYRDLKNGLNQLLAQPALVKKLKTEATAAEALKEMNVSSDIRTDLLNLLNSIETSANKAQPTPVTSASKAEEQSVEINSAKAFFEQAFKQLRRAYQISIVMSGLMFFCGLAFLGIAGYQALSNHPASASVVGGIGVIQIVALFYRNPLADIARSVSNAQQAKIAVTSYLIGITMLHDSIGVALPSEQHLASLLELTDKALGQLQTYVEDHRAVNENTGSRNRQ
jgi:hypothetical protein